MSVQRTNEVSFQEYRNTDYAGEIALGNDRCMADKCLTETALAKLCNQYDAENHLGENRLVVNSRGEYSVTPKSPGEVVGEKALRPIIDRVFAGLQWVSKTIEHAVEPMQSYLYAAMKLPSFPPGAAAEFVCDGDNCIDDGNNLPRFNLDDLLTMKHHWDIRRMINAAPYLLTITNSEGMNALHMAVSIANGEEYFTQQQIVEFLANKNPDLINQTNNDGLIPLCYAARNGNIAIMDILLSKRPEQIEAKGPDGSTLLHWVALSDKVNAIEYVMNKNMNLLEVKDHNGKFPEGWVKDTKASELLIKNRRCYTEFKDSDGYNCCMTYDEEWQIAFPMFDRNDRIGPFSTFGRRLFREALDGNIPGMAFSFEEYPASITETDRHGRTPFHAAVKNGHFEAAKWLWEKHPLLIVQRDKMGRTSLHYAALSGNVDLIAWIAKKLPELSDRKELYRSGKTPYDYAKMSCQVEAAEWLKERMGS